MFCLIWDWIVCLLMWVNMSHYHWTSWIYLHWLYIPFSKKYKTYVTITWGADRSSRIVAMTVNKVKIMRQSLSRTMAANFQSHSTLPLSSSLRIFSVITRSSFKIKLSSLTAPEGRGVRGSSKNGSSLGDLKKFFLKNL